MKIDRLKIVISRDHNNSLKKITDKKIEINKNRVRDLNLIIYSA